MRDTSKLPRKQRGIALITAVLVVALVTLVATNLSWDTVFFDPVSLLNLSEDLLVDFDLLQLLLFLDLLGIWQRLQDLGNLSLFGLLGQIG